ncbi:MAG: bifunctional folylpolyglutamate synthase/dihydrofolate synthase [Verrucomicrobia bacterium]|jgi:dihydrofolate synthase/folylpolyglutamate synthase|nr:bifunctional folylpolyglutamate synthase/dihydrofolate synthase [Verrucomicrobiota bacterium]
MKKRQREYASVRDYLYSLKYRGAIYGIDRMRRFVERLGHPERKYPVIHVAGTNGKGSTCAMLESIFRAAGYKTGLFTSPHLIYQGERIQVNRRLLDRASIIRYCEKLRPVAEAMEAEEAGYHPTFFEFMTGMAFLRFAEEPVDVAIIETGLGGRLDATNVVEPDVSIITSISLDHTDILGDTLGKIAREKAGIIKPGKPVVMGFLPAEAEAVIAEVAAERGSPLVKVADAVAEDGGHLPQTSLSGDYQRRNAAAAMTAARQLRHRFALGEEGIRSGLDRVSWAGRWESHELADRHLILDATHNPEGIEFLKKNLYDLVQTLGHKLVILTGTLGEVRAQALIPAVAPYARELHLLVPRQPRACSHEVLHRKIPASYNGPVCYSSVRELFPAPGIGHAGTPGETIVATGSIYLIGEIMEALYHEVPVGEETLQDG